MKIKYISDLEIFIRIADHFNLTSAANSLNLSPAVASASLKRLERKLGTLLFIRNTRSIRLTTEGERFLSRCRPLLIGLEEAEQEIISNETAINGLLHISIPSDLGRNIILDWLDEFQVRHPSVGLHIQLTDRISNVLKEPIDLAIRYGFPPDSNMVAFPLLSSNTRVLCASPSYIKGHPPLLHPSDLTQHNCLIYMLGNLAYDNWCFRTEDKNFNVKVSGNRISDDSDAVRRWAINGYGICYRSYFDMMPDIAAGRLQVLCTNWQGDLAPLYLISPVRQQISPTIRLLRDHLERCFQSSFNRVFKHSP